MQKKIITKISEGLGNQLFMYANSFALSKKFNLDFYIDTQSGYYKKKEVYNFMLSHFKISSKIAPPKYLFANTQRNILKKILIFFDKFSEKKKFIFEKRSNEKITNFYDFDIKKTNNIFFLDGNFETEKYFLEFKNDLYKELSIKNHKQFSNNKYLNYIKNRNVVSICIRQNRFSERFNNKSHIKSIDKSKLFVNQTIDYIYRAIDFFDNQIDDPLYLIWSNDFKNLNNFFSSNRFIFVDNKKNKTLTDFFLLTQCKNFIVSPSTFNWWGAWLSKYEDKICLRPKNLNNSNNTDFWPEKWISI